MMLDGVDDAIDVHSLDVFHCSLCAVCSVCALYAVCAVCAVCFVCSLCFAHSAVNPYHRHL